MQKIITELKEKLNAESWSTEELLTAIKELSAIIEDLAILIGRKD